MKLVKWKPVAELGLKINQELVLMSWRKSLLAPERFGEHTYFDDILCGKFCCCCVIRVRQFKFLAPFTFECSMIAN